MRLENSNSEKSPEADNNLLRDLGVDNAANLDGQGIRAQDINKQKQANDNPPAPPVDQRKQKIVLGGPDDEEIAAQRAVDRALRQENRLYHPIVQIEANQQKIDDAVKDLGDDKYPPRAAAQAFLEQVGEKALPALRTKLSDSDPEVRSSAKRLIDAIELRSILEPLGPTIEAYDKLPKDDNGRLTADAESEKDLLKIIDAVGADKFSSIAARIDKDPEWQGTLVSSDLKRLSEINYEIRRHYIESLVEPKIRDQKEIIRHLTIAIKDNPIAANDTRLLQIAKQVGAIKDQEFLTALRGANGDLQDAGFAFNPQEEEKFLRERLALLKNGQLQLPGFGQALAQGWTHVRLIDNLLGQRQPEKAGIELDAMDHEATVIVDRSFKLIDLYLQQDKLKPADIILHKVAAMRGPVVGGLPVFDDNLCRQLNIMATKHLKTGNRTEAISVHERALAIEDKDSLDWSRRKSMSDRLATIGRIYLEDNNLQEAQKRFDKGVTVSGGDSNPGQAKCFSGLAAIATKQLKQDLALEHLWKADYSWKSVFISNANVLEKLDSYYYPNVKEWHTAMQDLRKAYGNNDKYQEQAKELDVRIQKTNEALKKYEHKVRLASLPI